MKTDIKIKNHNFFSMFLRSHFYNYYETVVGLSSCSAKKTRLYAYVNDSRMSRDHYALIQIKRYLL